MPSAAWQQVRDRLRQDGAFRQTFQTTPLAALAVYPLTVEEREALVLPNFGWLAAGELAGSSQPRTEDALDLLQHRGLRAVLSLSAQSLPEASLAARSMVALHLPIANFTAPTPERIASALAAIDRFRAAGRPTLVHCGAGLGRTGTIPACFLVAEGMPAAAAIRLVRRQRPGSIETPGQEAAVDQFAQRSGHGPAAVPRAE